MLNLSEAPESAHPQKGRFGGQVTSAGGFRKRDLVLLPLISCLTIGFLLVVSEAAARFFFSKQDVDACRVADPNIVFRYRPNCTSRLKAAEGPVIENRYNDCGYRTAESCGPKRPGTLRIALLGSSTAASFLVPADQTLAYRVGKALTQSCGRPAEVQNVARDQCFPACTYRRMDEALALEPDAVVLAFSPFDLENISSEDVADRFKPMQRQAEPAARTSSMRKLQLLLQKSYAMTATEHFVFQDPSTYLRVALNNSNTAEFLRPQMSPSWDKRLANLDILLGEMAQKAEAAHVPFVFMEIPSLAQASVLAAPKSPPGVDVYALNQRLAALSARHGIQFVSVLDAFQRTPGANKMFYIVDGHLNGSGQALLVDPLVRQLTEGANPPLSACHKPRLAHGEGY